MPSPDWHLSYKLQPISASLETKLKQGEVLKEAERSAFLEAIYNSVKIYTYYPKTTQYDTIIRLMLEKYPRLQAEQEMSCADIKSLWKYRLQYKFANSRKREDNSIPAVKARKRKNNPEMQPKAKHVAPQWGMENYLPKRKESEDDTSIEIHTTWMKAEITKKKPNYQRVAEAMSATFADRRRLIIKESSSVAKMKELYPWLFEEDELLQEFQRIEGRSSITSLLDNGLAKYSEAIVASTKFIKKKHKLLADTLDKIPLQKDEETRKVCIRRAAILAVPSLLQEKVENMLVTDDQAETTCVPVYIVAKEDEEDGEDEYSIIVDGLTVSTTSTFVGAVANYLAVYYCFNLAYPVCLKKSLQFFQKVILNIQDNLQIEKSVVRILDKVNQILKQAK